MALSNSSADEPIYLYDLLRTIDALPLNSLSYDLLRTRQPTVTKACLASCDKNRNIDTYLPIHTLDTIR